MDKKDYIYGLRAVMEAIDAGKDMDKILLNKEMRSSDGLVAELLLRAKEMDIPVQRVPVERLNRITMKNHQGVVALLSPVTYYKLDQIVPGLYESGRVPFIILLDGITDTRNFGAIARTAECAGVDTIVIPERNSVSVNADAVKTSAGALMRMPVCRERDIETAVKNLKDNGYFIVGASEKGKETYTDADYTLPVAIVMGAEDNGISPQVLRLCDAICAIPLMGKIGSLNVSVAAGVMLYEVVRQRLLS